MARQLRVIDGSRRVSPPQVVTDEESPPDLQVSVDEDGTVQIRHGEGAKKAPTPVAAQDFNRNLAEGMDPSALAALAEHLLEGIEADLQSRKDWEDTANRSADYMGIKLQDPTTSVSADGTVCKTVATCMLEAVVKLWSTARAELLPVGGPVKSKDSHVALPQGAGIVEGSPDKLDDLANALETDMNWYLTIRDREYYPDFSRMLMSRAVIGNAFRKVFNCPLRRRPASVWVRAQDLIVSNDCSHLSGAGRVTERIRIQQSDMKRLQAVGHYLDVPLVMPTGQATDTEIAVGETEGIAPTPQLPQDFEHLVYECATRVGSTAIASLVGGMAVFDRDENGDEPGFPLPYRIAIDSDSRQVLEIRRNWKQGDADYEPRRRYVKYGFIPGFGFYDLGLIHLVGNPTLAATMIQRAAVDSALFANFPGGIYMKGPGSRQTETVIRPNPGQFIGMDAAGAQKAADIFAPMPYKPPDAQVLAMQQKFEGDVRRIAGVIELPVGEGRMGNVPVGTIMAYIDAISQVPGAVHKDDHVAQAEEFELLRELLAEDPEQLTRGNRSPARKQYTREELLAPDLSPQADPNTPSEVHRLMKTQALVAAGAMPQFQGIANQRTIWGKVVKQLEGGDTGEYTMPPQAPQQAAPPPQVIAAQLRAQSQTETNQAKITTAQITAQTKATEAANESQERQLDRDSDEARAAMSLKGKALEVAHSSANQAADRAVDQGQHLDNLAHKQTELASSFAAPLTAPDSSQPS